MLLGLSNFFFFWSVLPDKIELSEGPVCPRISLHTRKMQLDFILSSVSVDSTSARFFFFFFL